MSYSFSPVVDGVALHIQIASDVFEHISLADERPHRHNTIEFHYIFEGREIVTFQESEKKYLISPGKLIVIPSRMYHSSGSENSNIKRIVFNFSAESEDEKKTTQFYNFFTSYKEPRIFENERIRLSMNSLIDLLENTPATYAQEMQAGAILLDLILYILHSSSPEKSTGSNQLQNRRRQKTLIEEYISTKYNTSNGLQGLADELCLSERQTRKLVKKFYNEDYKSLIVKERMDSAKLLLKTTTLSLDEIASRIGYISYSGFHVAFVRTFNETPGQYRKRVKL